MSLLLDQIRNFARYNAWANRRLYQACADLPAEEYHAARPSFFGSLHATLNHILVGDSIWWGRFRLTPPAHITALNQILHADFSSLHLARQAMDEEIFVFSSKLDDAALAAPLTYSNISGKSFTSPLAPLLAHAHNHQTHHRGQAHQMLSMAGIAAPPELDYIFFLREIEQ